MRVIKNIKFCKYCPDLIFLHHLKISNKDKIFTHQFTVLSIEQIIDFPS